MKDIRVYGAGWCGDTRATKRQLDDLGLSYDYHDIDRDPKAKAWVAEHNGGKQKLPTVDVKGGILSVPDEDDLAQLLREKGLID